MASKKYPAKNLSGPQRMAVLPRSTRTVLLGQSFTQDDGESETRVEARLITALDGGGSDSDREAVLREGDKIDADYRGRGKFYPGKISRDRGDDTYDIAYDKRRAGNARLEAPHPQEGPIEVAVPVAARPVAYERATRLRARYRGRESTIQARSMRTAVMMHLRH